MKKKEIPGLFGQTHNNSNRDYTNEECWGKNQFNSSFPASLVAYMSYKGVHPVYLKTDAKNNVYHDYITGTELFGIDPNAENAFYNFESAFPPYSKFYTGDSERIDLVMMDSKSDTLLSGLEIKLTALPDSTTKKRKEVGYSTEIVVRPPTINFLVCSLCSNFKTLEEKNDLRRCLEIVPRIYHWEEPGDVLPNYEKILRSVRELSAVLVEKQRPLIIQTVWKTIGAKGVLADDCLDVFVWSNLAVLQMCANSEKIHKNKFGEINKITRSMRTVIWIYMMLLDFLNYGQFDYRRIIRLNSYNLANDKGYAISGSQTYHYLHSEELTSPRISKYEIKNIILGGGQNYLSPERRFDAVICNSPDLFV